MEGGVTHLLRLADETLSHILEFASLHVTSLWCAGDVQLNAKLVRCCRCIRTDPDLRTIKLKRWPRMISNLKSLLVLDIAVDSFSSGLEQINGEARLLPKSLTELSLHFGLAIHVFFDDSQRVPFVELDGDQPASIHQCMIPFPHKQSITSFWTPEFLPRLRKMKIRDRDSSYLQAAIGSFSFSLEHLEWQITPLSTFSLPPNITHVRLAPFDLELSPLLPSSLTRIDSLSYDWLAHGRRLSEGQHVDTLAWPPNLTSLSLSYRNFAIHDLKLIPRTLTELGDARFDATCTDTSYLQDLPPGLKILRAYSMGGRCTWTLTLPILVPLVELQLRYIDLDPHGWSMLPPTLRMLEITGTYLPEGDSPLMEQLPRSLECLELSNIHSTAFSFLPPRLVCLHLSDVYGPLTDEQGEMIPPTLRTLELARVAYSNPLIDFIQSEWIETDPLPHWLTRVLVEREKGI